MNHAGVKSSIDSSRMFNEPYAEIPSGALGTWGCPGSPGGRVHLSPSPSICLTDSFVSLSLPLFSPGCLPAWTPVTALGVEGFICLPLSPFICLPLSPSLDAWHGSLGGRVHLSPFVSLHLAPLVSQPGCLGGRVHLSPFVCFPSFVSRCLPAWMPGTALQADRFTCLPLSPFICLPLSPSLDAWHGSLGGQFHLSPFVSLHLAPLVSQPGCLSRLSRRTDSLVFLGSPSFISHLVGGRIDLSPFVSLYSSPVVSQPGCLSGWTDSFVSLCLPLFVSRCLPAWMLLWVDGFICLPLSPSLDVWHSRSAVSFTSRSSVLLAGSGLPSASALASVIPCLVDVGDRVLCLPFIWTSILLGLVVGRLPCLSLATPCLFVQCLVISCGLSLSLLAFGVPS